MSRKITSLLIAVSLVLTMITGCSSSERPASELDTSIGTPINTRIFVDSTGREVELPTKVTRIVPSGPAAQIVLFAIAPDMFAGLSNHWPNEAEMYLDNDYYNLPVLGQFYGKGGVNLEEIAKVDPQVIIDIGETKSTTVEDMDGITEQVGIPTVHIEATTSTMGDAYRMLGELLGREEEGERLAKYCEEVYNNTLDIMDRVGEEEKANLIYSVGEDGLSVISKGSFHAEIIDMVSNNTAIVDDISSKGTGNPVDMEQLLLWDPDIIIFSPGGAYSIVEDSEEWQELKAIKNGTYYEVPSGPYNWIGTPPSVNRYMGMIWFTQLLYPEEAQYDLYQETAKYYDLFYHCELTRDQYNALVANSIIVKGDND